MAVWHSRCPALICGLILDIADVWLAHVDQAVVLATINISSRVFAATMDTISRISSEIIRFGHNRAPQPPHANTFPQGGEFFTKSALGLRLQPERDKAADSVRPGKRLVT
jgi:hypothetical protein